MEVALPDKSQTATDAPALTGVFYPGAAPEQNYNTKRGVHSRVCVTDSCEIRRHKHRSYPWDAIRPVAHVRSRVLSALLSTTKRKRGVYGASRAHMRDGSFEKHSTVTGFQDSTCSGSGYQQFNPRVPTWGKADFGNLYATTDRPHG